MMRRFILRVAVRIRDRIAVFRGAYRHIAVVVARYL